jgi:hypothetical protein
MIDGFVEKNCNRHHNIPLTYTGWIFVHLLMCLISILREALVVKNFKLNENPKYIDIQLHLFQISFIWTFTFCWTMLGTALMEDPSWK